MKTRVRPSRWAFFYPGPVGSPPVGNGLFIAFAGASLGLLRTPPQTAHEMPDARQTIGPAEVAFNDGGNARQRPEFIAKAMSTSPLAEEAKEVLTLLSVESRLPTALPFGVQATVAIVRNHITPPTDRRGRGFDVTRHVTDTPARFQQGNRDASADFKLEFGAFGSHGHLLGRLLVSL